MLIKPTLTFSFTDDETVNGTLYKDGDIVQYNGSSVSKLFSETNFWNSNGDVDGIHVFTDSGSIKGWNNGTNTLSYSAGDILLSTSSGSVWLPSAGSGWINFQNEDIVLWDVSANSGAGGAVLLFDGSDVGASNIDAVSVNPDTGNLVFSMSSGVGSFDDGDLIEFDGSNFTKFFDENDDLRVPARAFPVTKTSMRSTFSATTRSSSRHPATGRSVASASRTAISFTGTARRPRSFSKRTISSGTTSGTSTL